MRKIISFEDIRALNQTFTVNLSVQAQNNSHKGAEAFQLLMIVSLKEYFVQGVARRSTFQLIVLTATIY